MSRSDVAGGGARAVVDERSADVVRTNLHDDDDDGSDQRTRVTHTTRALI